MEQKKIVFDDIINTIGRNIRWIRKSLVKLALLGAGRIGQLHGTNIQNNIPNAEIIVLADPYLSDQAKEWAAGVGIPVVKTDPDQVFANPEVAAVFI